MHNRLDTLTEHLADEATGAYGGSRGSGGGECGGEQEGAERQGKQRGTSRLVQEVVPSPQPPYGAVAGTSVVLMTCLLLRPRPRGLRVTAAWNLLYTASAAVQQQYSSGGTGRGAGGW